MNPKTLQKEKTAMQKNDKRLYEKTKEEQLTFLLQSISNARKKRAKREAIKRAKAKKKYNNKWGD